MGHVAQFIPMITTPKMQMLTAFKILSLDYQHSNTELWSKKAATLDGAVAHCIILIIMAHRCLSILLKL